MNRELHIVKPICPSERFLLAEQADSCVRWLKRQGFSVIGVQKGHACTRITIRQSPLCEKLEGVVSAYERTRYGERRYSFVYRMGFEVRWIEGSVQ